MNTFQTFFALLLFLSFAFSLDNGLALTPPMGWLHWERFRCNVDCAKDPKECISENLFLEMAERMKEDGFLEAGYKFLNIDDCWMSETRNSSGHLEADPERFPHGMSWLSDQIRSMGLKFGIYQAIGNKTCQGYPGIDGYTVKDIQTFASWKIDMLKLDGCYGDVSKMSVIYPKIERILNATGLPIVYSCSWPAYERDRKMKTKWDLVVKTCNLWRIYTDIEDGWESVMGIVNYWAANQHVLTPLAGPGHWNDPDMIVVGNAGLNYEESKAQFALWAILAAPLLMSNDLRSLSPWAKEILLNKEVIAVNQDPLGRQGTLVSNKEGLQVWARELHDGIAVLLFNSNSQGSVISFNFDTVGSPSVCRIRDLFAHQDLGIHQKSFSSPVGVHSVVLLKLTRA